MKQYKKQRKCNKTFTYAVWDYECLGWCFIAVKRHNMIEIILKNKVSNQRFYPVHCHHGEENDGLHGAVYQQQRSLHPILQSGSQGGRGEGDTGNTMGFETSLAISINMNILSPIRKSQLHQGLLNFPRQFTHWGLSMQIYKNMGIILIQTNAERILSFF